MLELDSVTSPGFASGLVICLPRRRKSIAAMPDAKSVGVVYTGVPSRPVAMPR